MSATLDQIFSELQKLNKRFDSFEERMDRIEQHMDKLEQRIDRLEQRMDRLEQRVTSLELNLKDFKEIEQTHFEIVTDWFHRLKNEFSLKYESLNIRVNENSEKISTLTATVNMQDKKLTEIESLIIDLSKSVTTDVVSKTGLKSFAEYNGLNYNLK